MNLYDLIIKRQSDRKYTDKPVLRADIEKCIEAARMAPSASNSQPWSFIVVDNPELKNKIAHSTYGPLKSFNKFVPQAPVIVAIVMEKPKVITELGGRIKKKEYPLIDIGIAAEHFCLQAAELDLGTCMLGWFDEKKIKRLISVPESKNIPLLITLGHTPDNYPQRAKIRKKSEEVLKYNKY